jgi:plasmid stabilization system protein ParE
MKYRVTVLPRAKRQLLDQALWWARNRSVEQALRWLDGFETALATLGKSPERHTTARESGAVGIKIRELHYGVGGKSTHRAVFEIRGDEVIVYAVRHLAQSDLGPGGVAADPAG